MSENNDHQKNWWGIQQCRRCNPSAVVSRPTLFLPSCTDCDGSGWTEWAALATSPWTEIIPNLWVGGHDYNAAEGTHPQWVASISPRTLFDVVISLYSRHGSAPGAGTSHHEFIFDDAELTPDVIHTVRSAADIASKAVTGGKKTLVRCQAGLNRSSLVASMALMSLGFSGTDAVQLIRAKRSPWALCNEHYEKFLESQ